jgi:hypothetical protein
MIFAYLSSMNPKLHPLPLLTRWLQTHSLSSLVHYIDQAGDRPPAFVAVTKLISWSTRQWHNGFLLFAIAIDGDLAKRKYKYG